MFHLLNFACAGARAGVFPFRRTIDDHVRPAILVDILMDLPGLLFFTTYTLLVLFWAEIYHQARSLPTDSLRPTFVVANVFTYLFQASLWTWAGLEARDRETLRRVSSLFLSIVSFAAAVVSRCTADDSSPCSAASPWSPRAAAKNCARWAPSQPSAQRVSRVRDGGALDLYVRGSTRRALAPGEKRGVLRRVRDRAVRAGALHPSETSAEGPG